MEMFCCNDSRDRTKLHLKSFYQNSLSSSFSITRGSWFNTPAGDMHSVRGFWSVYVTVPGVRSVRSQPDVTLRFLLFVCRVMMTLVGSTQLHLVQLWQCVPVI